MQCQKSVFHFKLQMQIATSNAIFNFKLEIYTSILNSTLCQSSSSYHNFKLYINLKILSAISNSASNFSFKLQLQSFSDVHHMQNMTPKTIVSRSINMVGFKLLENLRIKKRGRTDRRTNELSDRVTS